MINVTLPQSSLSSIARQGRRVLLIALFVSVFIHLFSYVNLDYFARQNFLGNLAQHSQPVRFNIVDSKSKLDPELPDAQQKKMAEVIQAPTVRPNDARYSSFQDHQTERETRIDVRDSEAGKKAGPKGHSDKAQIEQRKVDLEAKPKLEIFNQQSGSLEFMYNNKDRHEKRERYQKL